MRIKINIVGGRGIMGIVHKPVFESAGNEVTISGRYSAPDIITSAKSSDVTIVSVPIPAVEDVIQRVAPYCKAIMDFTSVKMFPIKLMLKYSKEDTEVGGLHPLYGEVTSILDKTIIYCPTERSGKLCEQVIKSFELAGAKIKIMEPELHDLIVSGISQTARVKLLSTFALLIEKCGITAEELYEVSPAQTRLLLDIIARQVDERNDELYKAINKYNPFTEKINEYLLSALEETEQRDTSIKIRELYQNKIEKFRKRAELLLN